MDKNTREQNRKEMFLLIEQYQTSNLSQEKYCEEKGISLSRFYYWQKRYNEKQSGQNGFAPVQISNGKPKTFSANLEIQYPNGVILRLPSNVPITLLRNFISGI